MKYTAGCVKHVRGDICQVRFSYYVTVDGEKRKRSVSRNFRAKSKRAAEQMRDELHDKLERETEMSPRAKELMNSTVASRRSSGKGLFLGR